MTGRGTQDNTMSHQVETITGKYLRVDLLQLSLSWHSKKIKNGTSILSTARSEFQWLVSNSERQLCSESIFFYLISE